MVRAKRESEAESERPSLAGTRHSVFEKKTRISLCYNERMNENKKSLVPFGIIMGVSLVVVSIIVGYVIYYVKTYDNAVITVTGVATKEIKSDDAKWRSSFSDQTGAATADLQKGSADMQNELQTILAYFASNGIATSSITVNPLEVDPMYQTQNGIMSGKYYGAGGTLVGYSLTQSLLVESGNVDEITKLAQDAPQYLIGKGIVFSSQAPEYYITNSTLDSIRQEMLQKALADAKTRAEAITEGVGASVGNLRSSSIGVTQITPVNSTQISDYGAYDTTTADKLITYLVHTTFTLR